MLCRHYRATNGKGQLPRIDFKFYLHVSSFHELQAFARIFKETLLFFFEDKGHTTVVFISELNSDNLNKRGFHKHRIFLNRQLVLFCSPNGIKCLYSG